MIAARVFGLAQLPNAYDPVDLQPAGRSLRALLTFPVIRWDGDWYLAIARHGYALSAHGLERPRTNFFPLYPLAVRALSVVGVPLVIAAVLVSIGCLALALYTLARLMDLELERGGIRGGASAGAVRLVVLALALSPVSFFLSSAYAESLYLALSVGAFLCARRGQWARAGTLAGLGAAARGPGVLLLVPLLFLYLYGPRDDRAADLPPERGRPRYRLRVDVLWLGLAPLGLLGYMVYLTVAGVDPLSFVHTQREIWHHVLAWPWTTVWEGARDAVSELGDLLTGGGHATLFGTYVNASVATGWENLLPFAALVLAVVALAGTWRRLPRAYGIYVTAAILLNLISPVNYEPLQSLPRYVLVLFPLFIWLGLWLAEHPRLRLPALVASGAALALLSAEFATWHFVA
ncbi:MAG: hypothetical protein M3Z27_00555 [Actinomycetota bacterium]|nr:hypothetical protein [Actinomycetota bacterium]